MIEHADDYPHIVDRLNETTRVIECKNRIQWIVQFKIGSQWRNRWFCRTKEALLRGCPSSPALEALPDRFVEPPSSRRRGALGAASALVWCLCTGLLLSWLLAAPAMAVPLNSKLEGFWLYKDVKRLLTARGFQWDEMPECLNAKPSAVAVHCTSDFWNDDGVRLSVAVRKRVDVSSPGRAYRIVCTAGCRNFTWGSLISGQGRKDPLE